MMDNKRILLIKMSSLGDIIQAWPVVVAIKKAYPNAHITWAVQEQFKDLVLMWTMFSLSIERNSFLGLILRNYVSALRTIILI